MTPAIESPWRGPRLTASITAALLGLAAYQLVVNGSASEIGGEFTRQP